MTGDAHGPAQQLSAGVLFDTMIDTAPEGFALFDRELRYVRVNQALARINGLSPADHVGRTVQEVTPDVPSEGHAEPLAFVLNTGEPVVDLEVNGFTAADPDDPRTWLVSYYPVRDSDGSILLLGAIVVDITERKRQETRSEILAELGGVLDEVVGVEQRLHRLTRLLVPGMVDVCAVTLRLPGGSHRRVAVAHVDPEGEAQLARLPAVDEDALAPLPRTPGGSILVDALGETVGAATGAGPEELAIRRRWTPGAAVMAPMDARGRRIGHLTVGLLREHRWSEHEIALVEEIAQRVAMTVENARLLESERAARDRIARLQAVTARLSESLTSADVARAVLGEGMTSAGARMAAIWQLDEGERALHLIGHRGFENSGRSPMRRIELSAPLPVPDAVRRQQPVWLGDPEDKLERYPALAARAPGVGRDPLYILPLTARAKPVGALALCLADAQALTDEVRAFAGSLAAQCAQALERARLFEVERQVAATLQRSLLPHRMPAVPGAEFAVRYLPAAGLDAGGDFYEAIQLPAGRIGLAVGDVVGRGAQAAAAMGQLRSALRAFAMSGAPPADVLRQLSAFAESVDGALAATAAYMVLDPEAGELRYACAGHPYPLLAREDGTADFLRDGRSIPLGVLSDPEYNEGVARVGPGCMLLLYTDGLVERRGEDVEVSLRRLRETLVTIADAPLDELLEQLVELQGAGAPLDDVALLALRRVPETSGTRNLRFPAEPASVGSIRREVRTWLESVPVAPALITDLLLACGEAVANAVEHAGAGEVELGLRTDSDAVEIMVRDDGAWREGTSDPDRGRGFGLMRALVDELDVEHERGTVVRLRRTLNGAEAADAPPPPPPARVEVGPGGALVARLTGDLDIATAPAAGEQLALLADGGLVVDLSGVGHLDSTGLHMLVRTAQRAGGSLTVIAPQGSAPRRAIDLSRVEDVLLVRDA